MHSIPSSEDLAYLAGVFDGEGCFDIHHDHRNNSLIPRIRVEMTHFQTVNWIQELFPANKIYVYTGVRSNRKCSTTYKWCIHGLGAIEVARLVFPYLKAKKDEAGLFITFPYPVKISGNGRRLPEEIVRKRMEIRFALREYKTKGKGLIKGGAEHGE